MTTAEFLRYLSVQWSSGKLLNLYEVFTSARILTGKESCLGITCHTQNTTDWHSRILVMCSFTNQFVCFDVHTCQYLHLMLSWQQEFQPENFSSLSHRVTHCSVCDPDISNSNTSSAAAPAYITRAHHHHHHYSACTMSVRSSACYQ